MAFEFGLGEIPSCAFDSKGPPMTYAKAYFGCGVIGKGGHQVLVAAWEGTDGTARAEILAPAMKPTEKDWTWTVVGRKFSRPDF